MSLAESVCIELVDLLLTEARRILLFLILLLDLVEHRFWLELYEVRADRQIVFVAILHLLKVLEGLVELRLIVDLEPLLQIFVRKGLAILARPDPLL